MCVYDDGSGACMWNETIKNYRTYLFVITLIIITLGINYIFRLVIPQGMMTYFGVLVFVMSFLGMVYGIFSFYKRHLTKEILPKHHVALYILFAVNNLIAYTQMIIGHSHDVPMIIYALNWGISYFAIAIFLEQSDLEKPRWVLKLGRTIRIWPLVLFGVESFIWFAIVRLKLDITLILFFMNAINAALYLRVYIKLHLTPQVASEKLGITLLCLGHIYLALVGRESLFIHIQAMWMVIFGIVMLLWLPLNVIKRLLDHQNEKLLKQFNVYSKNMRKLIDKKTLQVREANVKIIEELEYAKVVQQSLLPQRQYAYRDVVIYSDYFPCERLSGDFYDVMRIDEDYIALYYMDVAGHGISAALLTMLTNNFLKAQDQSVKRLWAQRPDKSIQLLYEHINTLSLPDEIHLVILYATYHLSTNVLTYCSGGMNCAPIVFRKNGTFETLDQSGGFPICMMKEFHTPDYNSIQIKLQKGDRILFYTDGLTDIEKNGIYNEQMIINLFRENRKTPIKEVNELLSSEITEHKDDLNDDITYIIMEI